MPHQLTKLTPNLIVADVDRSLAFYRDVLGFSVALTVPEQSPFAFAIVRNGSVEINLNAPGPALEEYPAFAGRPIGGTFTLFIDVSGIHEAWAALQSRVSIVMPLEKKWYGLTEFAFVDPDGYVITFAEQTAA